MKPYERIHIADILYLTPIFEQTPWLKVVAYFHPWMKATLVLDK